LRRADGARVSPPPETLDSFAKLLAHHARTRGDRPAIREKRRGIWRDVSWRAFAEEASALAAALSAQGLARGAHVAFLGDNRPRLFVGMAAAHILGAVATPLFQDAPAAEIVGALRLARVTHAFAQNQEQVDKLLSVLPQCPDLRVVVFDDDRSMRHYRQPCLAAYDRLLAEGRAAIRANAGAVDAAIAAGTGADPAFVFFTAGASGPPRGAVFTAGALLDRARAAAGADGIGETDATLAYLPPGWLAQTLFSYAAPMATGACVCCPESSDTVLADLREVAPSFLVATPRLLATIVSQAAQRIEDAGGLNLALYRRASAVADRVGRRRLAGGRPGLVERLTIGLYDLMMFGPLRDALGMTRIRAAYTTGDAVDPGLLAFFRALGVNLKELYGTTESGYVVAIHRDDAVTPDSVGHPARGVEVRIGDDGAVSARSPGLFSGYLGDPEATRRVLDAEGWLATGDAGFLRPDGQLVLVDRAGDIGTLAGGARFAPRRIETRIKASPYVREALAIGDGRDFLCALVDIEAGAAGRWADAQGIPYTGHADLASREEVYGLIGAVLAEANAALAADPATAAWQVRRFVLLPKELDADDGLLTRTGKVRRAAVAERFAGLIDEIYAGLGAGHDESAERDPHAPSEKLALKIRDVPKTAGAAAPGRRAA
jgi:long-chain acyl-CoA synthetase